MFGPPKIMGSDKGTEFVNKIVEQLCNACGIEHRVTSAYHPQANGHTERFNGTLITMLKKHAEENQMIGINGYLSYSLHIEQEFTLQLVIHHLN
jgi:transposase InsO family protein